MTIFQPRQMRLLFPLAFVSLTQGRQSVDGFPLAVALKVSFLCSLSRRASQQQSGVPSLPPTQVQDNPNKHRTGLPGPTFHSQALS